jgi:dCMP deaminase
MLMQIAEVVARRSTCFRRNVGAVIAVDGRVVSIGYNGSPAGEEHCIGVGCAGPQGCTRAIHAEINAFNYVPPGMRHHRKTLYVTESPCPTCAEEILHNKVDAVYFLHQYRLDEGCKLLVKNGTRLYRMTPGGHLVDWKTNELVNEA